MGDDHRDPSMPDEDRAWLHCQLDPVLDSAASRPRRHDPWTEIAERAAAGDVATPPEQTAGSHRGRRWLAAAAVLVLVTGAAALVADRSRDHDSVVSGAAESETGWYAPTELPDGWTVRSVTASRGAPVCEAWGTEWTDPGRGSISLTYDRCPDTYQADADARDRTTTVLDGGITATGPWYTADIDSGSGPRVLHWDDDGGWTVRGGGITDAEAIAVANAAIADPHRTDIPVDGFELLDRWSRPDRDRSPTVEVLVEAPNGRFATYELTLPGSGISDAGWNVLKPTEVDGQALPVVKVLEPPPVDGNSSWTSLRYQGRWPGADLAVDRRVIEDKEDEAISDRDLEELVGSLRPASSDQWQDFLDTVATVSPGLRIATTLADVGSRGVPPTSTTEPVDDPETSQPADPADPVDPVDPSPADPIVSDPAITVGLDGPAGTNDSFTELGDLSIRVELSSGTVGMQRPIDATLLLENTSDHSVVFTECSQYLTTGGVVEARATRPPQQLITDCYATAMATIAPGDTARVPLAWVSLSPRRTAPTMPWDELGTLPPGPGFVVVEVPGKTSNRRIEVPVTIQEPACQTTDALVESYRGLTRAEAETKASSAGEALRVASIDGNPEDLTKDLSCERINVSLVGGLVTDALRY